MKREVKLKRKELEKKIKYFEHLIRELDKYRAGNNAIYHTYELCPVSVEKTYYSDFHEILFDDFFDDFAKRELASMLGMFLLDNGFANIRREKIGERRTRYMVKTYAPKKR